MTKLKKIADDEYKIIDLGEENFHRIFLQDTSPFPGVEYQYGAVKLFEENDTLRVAFEYEVFENKANLNTNSEWFREYIGHILMTNLEELLIYNKYQREKSNGN